MYRWRKQPPIHHLNTLDEFSTPPVDADNISPAGYFEMFWDSSITQKLADETNLYSVQQSGVNMKTTPKEIQQFIGIQMKMSLVHMPNYELYWANETRYEPVASVMSSKRYKKIRQFLHANDNTHKDDSRLYKAQPILIAIRNNCQKIELEHDSSIDEQIIPAKTKYSGIRQYNPQKPVKWGFKNFVLAGKSGFMYDFFIYTGSKSAGTEKCGAESVVLRLAENIPKHQGYRLFFDNWFSTLELMIKLQSMGILATATFRCNRLANCPLKTEKDLEKNGRGSIDYRTDQNSGIHLVRWMDNKCVTLGSTYVGTGGDNIVKRWDGKQRKHIDVSCPDIVKTYNESMGGVDLADMLISLYRTTIKSKRWYLKIIFHCVDICKVNAWLLYRRHCNQRGILKRKQLTLLQFTSHISEHLIKFKANASIKVSNVGRPKRSLSPPKKKEKRGRPAPLPVSSVRMDSTCHWPIHGKKNRCRHCTTGFSRIYCEKCKICLCINESRNCFKTFHNAE